MPYNESDYLQLSGIQHFCFCRRQWALIHIERQWAENYRTTDGELMHQRAHNRGISELRSNLLTVRDMPVSSEQLGVSGDCDVVEFRRDPHGVALHGREGTWSVCPVEYKRGSPKSTDADRLQLCLQAMCLEEMLCCEIPVACLYYGETRRRETVDLSAELRQTVRTMLSEMHELYRRGYTPTVKPAKGCNACSLKELCLPKLMRKKSAMQYLAEAAEVKPCDNC